MSSDQLEATVIMVLLLGFAGMSIYAMLLHERVHQLTMYIKRIEK